MLYFLSEKMQLRSYSNSSANIMQQVITDHAHQPDFPKDYCNIASKKLLETLQGEGKKVRLQHSFKEDGDGHTFVIETQNDGSELILDPTYAQYDESYTQ